MVEFHKLARAFAAVIHACANVLIAVALRLTRMAARIEKRAAPK